MIEQKESIVKDREACYAAFKAHDSRFDGLIYVGVSSTGIYCRPICRVKIPKIENCSYYSTAAAAEAKGFRPCLKCRPELAPSSLFYASQEVAKKAATMMEDGSLSDSNLSKLAEALNVTDRHLRRVFFDEFGVSPVQYLQTYRLLLAKQLLTETKLSITDIAMSSGFGSIRRFNDLFKKQYKLTPTALRKNEEIEKNISINQEITLQLGYRAPYEWEKLLLFLKGRAISGVEAVDTNSYRRTVAIYSNGAYKRGWLSVKNDSNKNSLLVTISASLLSVISKVLFRVRGLFDLDCEPMEIYEKLSVMNELSPNLCIKGLRVPGCFEPYETALRTILGQQITVKGAQTLAMRIASKFGEKIATPYDDLTHTFPTPKTIHGLETPIENHLCPLGVTGARARSIFALTKAFLNGFVTFSRYSNIESEINNLLTLPGIGKWTAEYMVMRILCHPDVFLHTDYGVKKAMNNIDEKEILKISEKWRPWRSYAVMNLWNSL